MTDEHEFETMNPKPGGPQTPRWAATVTWKKSSGEVVARKDGLGVEEIDGPEMADIIEKGPPWGDAPIVIIELAYLHGEGGVMHNRLDKDQWCLHGERNGWAAPAPAAWWRRRLPFLNAFRWRLASFKVHQHNKMWLSLGLIPTGYDEWIVYGMYRGWL